MAINPNDTNRMKGSPGGGAYQGYGVGNSTSSYREATRKGMWPGDNAGGGSQGETSGAGSVYSALLNERPNISNPRNRGPERAPSRSGATPLPVVGQSSRSTGRVSG